MVVKDEKILFREEKMIVKDILVGWWLKRNNDKMRYQTDKFNEIEEQTWAINAL